MISIAIDGPAGAGKSTIAKAVSKQLEYIYVDTGALYRSIALNAINNGTNTDNEAEIDELLNNTKVEIKFINGEQRVFLNSQDVSDKIRTTEVSMMASKVSAIAAVRDFLLELQRGLARENNVIMDGRDIGTVVLPQAQVKIFLTASAQCRAKRRYKDYLAAGNTQESYEQILADIQQRDYNDSHRAVAPLKPAEDSVVVDTSDDTLEQSVEKIIAVVNSKIK
ncbi:(d)CMP kinase [Oscillospiraceae bacterium LCP25S3_E10]|nr:(d)CMP kinase [Ruminococcus sp.]MDD6447717.1 (d)CMP kinase [Ruminococcus sp.]MDY2857002.1 (d)CMP kinase [Oscillospiraceae bacterium]